MILKIIFNEIKYNWWIYTIGYVMALIFLILFLITGREIEKFMIVTTGIFHLILISTGIRFSQEKRERLWGILPITLSSVARAQIWFLIFFQSGILLLWLVFFLVHYSITETEIWFGMLTANALILLIVFLFNINYNLGHYQTCHYRIYFWIIVTLFIFSIFMLIVITDYMNTSASIMSVFGRAAGTIVSNLLFLIVVFVDSRIFRRRRSYT